MVSPFNRWTERIIAAEDESSRRALVAEITRWRAGCLTDVAKQRDSAHALARLYMLLSQQQQAVQEGQTLMSLCQIPPEATDEEWSVARAFLTTLGGSPPKRTSRSPKNRKKDVKSAPQKGDQVGKWVHQAISGDGAKVRAALKGKKGPRIQMLRVWLTLQEWTQEEPGEKRDKLIERLERRVLSQLAPDIKREKTERPEQSPKPAPIAETDRELAAIMGRAIPRRRDSRVRLLERFAIQHPDKSDAVAAAALTHHVAVSGLEAPAPWFVGLVGRAFLDSDGAKTQKVMAGLKEKKAVCMEPFVEPTFQQCLDVVRLAISEGWQLNAWRRGVLPRVEPTDRKIWTIRLEKDDGERLLAVALDTEAPYDAELVPQLVERIPQLSKAALLLAPGVGNQGLRESAVASGLSVTEDTGATSLLAQLGQIAPPEVSTAEAPKPQSRSLEGLKALLAQEEPPELEALVGEMGALNRAREVFRVIRDLTNEGNPLASDRLALVLAALHQVVPEGSRLLEGTTLAVQALCAEENQTLLGRLTTGDEASRYGGAGINGVLSLAKAAVGGEWNLDRVLRGTTRRERRDSEVLESIGAGADEIWRMVFERGDDRGEIVYMESLSPEGRAALPQLLLTERNRVVVLPVEPELIQWYQEAGGPEPIGWTGSEGAAVVDAMQGWAN